ncbi:MAG: hypothetical protein DHS20C12_28250 [Pseudohongiella sp.]|nr:MAG: hypothetical protein DHS20C12_28250 [Pseudohongiella sp.]
MPNSKISAIVLGMTFVAVGILGFIPNPLVSETGIFVTNAMHNLVHLITGGVFLLAMVMPGKETRIITGIGAAYVVVSIVGFLTGGDTMLGLIHINQADKWLHVALAIGILGIAYLAPAQGSTVEE